MISSRRDSISPCAIEQGAHLSSLEVATEVETCACKRILEHRNSRRVSDRFETTDLSCGCDLFSHTAVGALLSQYSCTCRQIVDEIFKGFAPPPPPENIMNVSSVHPVYVDLNSAKEWLNKTEQLRRESFLPWWGIYLPSQYLEESYRTTEAADARPSSPGQKYHAAAKQPHPRRTASPTWFLNLRLLALVLSTPKLKFISNTISDFVFLALFTYVVSCVDFASRAHGWARETKRYRAVPWSPAFSWS